MLTKAKVYSLPIPFAFLTSTDLDRLANQNWDLIILNLPSLHALQVAWVLSNGMDVPFIKRRSIFQGSLATKEPTSHVTSLVEIALKFKRASFPIAILGDPIPFHEALHKLKTLTEPSSGELFDAESKPIWVNYKQKPWVPHKLPQPTGKLLTFRSWK